MKHIIKFVIIGITGVLMLPTAALITLIDLIWKAGDSLTDKTA